MAQVQVKLPEEVAKKYQLVNYTGGDTQVWGKHGTITVSKITLEQAARLVKNKWPKLQELQASAATTKAKGE